MARCIAPGLGRALVVATLATAACATPKTIIEVPPCADKVEISGQAQRLAPRRFELDHTFDLAFTRTELSFQGKDGTQTLVLDNDQPDPVRAVVGAGVTVLGAILLGTAVWDVTANERSLLEERPFYEAVWGAGMLGVGSLALGTGWHPDRSYVEWQGVCPVGAAAPSLEVMER